MNVHRLLSTPNGRQLQYNEVAPPDVLADVVNCFWFLRGRMDRSAPQTVIADGRIELILQLDEPLVPAGRAPRWPGWDDALIAGQLTQPLEVTGGSAMDVVGIRFRTAAAGTILRANLARLVDGVAPLAESDGILRLRLLDSVRGHPRPDARASALAAVLVQRKRGTPDAIASGFVEGCAPGGDASVESAAERMGITTRTLQRRVAAACGATPALVRRTTRFRRAYRAIAGAPPGTWARIAVKHGYFDQAHFIREFRQFTGAAPGEFLAASASCGACGGGDWRPFALASAG